VKPTGKIETAVRQAEWTRHSRDEKHAIRKQQVAAGPSHEPVGDPGAATLVRQQCAAAVRRWLDPEVIAALTGPLTEDSVFEIQSVLGALAAELVLGELPD